MNDLISRKAAIDALGKEGLITAMVIIDRVPSAQPVARDINVLSNDLVDRQAAIDALGERPLVWSNDDEYALGERPLVWSNDDEYALGERNQYDIDRLAIETVPSAQPEQPSFSCGHEDDLISRKAVIDQLHQSYNLLDAERRLEDMPYAQPDNDMIHLQKEQAYLQGWEEGREALRKKQQWTPIKVRPMDDEERKEWSERIGYDIEYDEAVMFDCPMPDDGQEVWVCSKCGNVWQDTCRIDEGIYLEENGDWLDIVAWMPFDKPEPFRREGDQ